MNKLISVIIPVKDGTNYLGEAVESIVGQNLDTEIIVVDDCSSDGTVQLAASLGCKVLRHAENKGQVAGKNTGVAAAAGEYILLLDHDDRLRPGALKVLLDALEARPEAVAVEAMVKDFVSPELQGMPVTGVKANPFYGLFTGAILIRRKAFEATGPFPEISNTGEIIWWFRALESNGLKVEKIDFISTDRRIHNTNFGKTHKGTEFKDYAAFLRARVKNAGK